MWCMRFFYGVGKRIKTENMNLPYILAHFIGDFLLQNDWMAVGKKKSKV